MRGDDEKRFPKPKVLPPPWWAPEFMLADLVAMQALAAGTADAEQQARALRWIIGQGKLGMANSACGTYDLGWHPNGSNDASFAAGRRFAGLQIVKLINANPADYRKEPHAS